MSQLDRDILDARKAGLSYGEYMGTKRKREERL
nr:MAG TPA: hypothetical protein [Caudovirales sp. ctNII2]